jgi:hypothetical protein
MINIRSDFEITRKNYDFGVSRTIAVGIDYHIIISQENWGKIEKLESEQVYAFKDKQGTYFEVYFDENNKLNFYSPKDHDLIILDFNSLA